MLDIKRVLKAAPTKMRSREPLQQLWIFWLAPVLAAAIVALVMIIADMASKRKPKTPADAPID